ncbi:MAG: hypothetical protein ACKVQU_32750 [Burkholderiales bacterium]
MNARRANKRVIIAWAMFACLIALIIGIELFDRNVARDDEAVANSMQRARLVLPVPIEQLSAIEVVHDGAIHRFERDPAQLWFYHGVHGAAEASHAHQTDPEHSRQIEHALQGFGRARTERQFPTDKGVQSFGLAVPQMVILAYAKNQQQPLLQLAVGDIAPDSVSRYVLAVGSASVVTIANFQIDNLITMIKSMRATNQGSSLSKAS